MSDDRCCECMYWHRCRVPRGKDGGMCEASSWDGFDSWMPADLTACKQFERSRPLYHWHTCPTCEREFLARAWETECPKCRGGEAGERQRGSQEVRGV